MRVKVFNQVLEISTNSVDEIKGYANAKIKDIFQEPNKLLETVSLIKKETETNYPAIQTTLENKSNFLLFVTSIEKDDVQMSFESVIEDKLILMVILKIPPHAEDLQTLETEEIIQETSRVSFSVLVGK